MVGYEVVGWAGGGVVLGVGMENGQAIGWAENALFGGRPRL